MSVVCALRRLAHAGAWMLLGLGFAHAVSVAFPAPALAAPPSVTASFDFDPASPFTRERVTFTSTSVVSRTIVSELWDLDNDGQFDDASGRTAARSFAAPGKYTVRLQVAIEGGVTGTAARTVTVRDRPPVASFEFSPAFPQTTDTVTFKSTSTDPDGPITSQSWDLDNDGQFDDGNGTTTQRSFRTAGSFTVSLRVVDDHGATSVASRVVPVGNRPPTASFSYVPASPRPGETVTFFSTATDPDGPIAEQSWDLDNDGQFDDGAGASASRAFDGAGSYLVGLKVTDDQGLSVAGFQTIVVRPSSITLSSSGLRLLTPFPIVRISGTITSSGVRLRRLSVTAPKGATIVVRCRGRGCPPRRYSRKAALIRVRAYERRLLRAGARLEVFIRKPAMVGKYTRFRIRSGKAPARLDRCLLPDARRPVRCPG